MFDCFMQCNRLQSIPFLVSAFLSPLVGMAVDYGGHRTSLIAVTPLMLVCAHVIIAGGLWNPYLPLILIGMAYRFVHAFDYPFIYLQ